MVVEPVIDSFQRTVLHGSYQRVGRDRDIIIFDGLLVKLVFGIFEFSLDSLFEFVHASRVVSKIDNECGVAVIEGIVLRVGHVAGDGGGAVVADLGDAHHIDGLTVDQSHLLAFFPMCCDALAVGSFGQASGAG